MLRIIIENVSPKETLIFAIYVAVKSSKVSDDQKRGAF